MAKSDLPHSALKIGYMHLMDSGLFRQIDLSPASLLTKIPDSPAELDTDIRRHSSSIDLVEALFSGCTLLPRAAFRSGLSVLWCTSSAREVMRKALLNSESDAVIEAYNSPDIYNLLSGNATWRLLNAISWIAGSKEDAERKLELMKITGDREREPNTDAIKVAHTANLSNLPLFITGSIFC